MSSSAKKHGIFVLLLVAVVALIVSISASKEEATPMRPEDAELEAELLLLEKQAQELETQFGN